ncbi:hypothetical protein TW81_09055 [Vibrio galatheae]|uniref:Uncharacterized protein n=1 Tax=Vibrio galatheae TaxID=579748 RepID=A0A0F4NJ50_9VIBR|nr:hypothetical protein TW81_09055 [Vibrio galatheae]
MGTHNEFPNLLKFVDYTLSVISLPVEQSSIYTLKVGRDRLPSVQFIAIYYLLMLFKPTKAQNSSNMKNWR